MRARLTRSALLTCVVLLISLCLGGMQATAKEEVKLEFWCFWSGPDKVLSEVLPEVQKLYPDVTVKLDAKVMPYQEMHDKLYTALVTGKGAPDIASIELNSAPRFFPFLAQGKILDLSGRIKKFKKDIPPGRIPPYTYKGKLLGFEESLCSVVMFYQDAILKKNGFDLDSVETWAQFRAMGRKLKQKAGIYSIVLSNGTTSSDFDQFWILLQQAGGGLYDKNGKVILDNKIGVEVLTFYVNLIKDGSALAQSGDDGNPVWYAPFKAGEAVSLIDAEWFGCNLKDYVPEMKGQWRVRALPCWKKGGPRTSSSGGTVKAITSTCKRPDIAWALIREAQLTVKGSELFFKYGAVYPVYLPAYDSSVLNEPEPYFGGQKVAQVIKPLFKEQPPFYLGSRWVEAVDIVIQKAIYPVVKGTKTPAAALKDAANELRKLE